MSSPSRSRLLFVCLSALLVVPLLTGGLVGARPSDDDEPYKYLSVFTEVLRLVRTVYVEEPNLDVLMAGAMDGAADALDPFSFYVPPERAEAFGNAQEQSRRESGLLLLKERGVAFAVAVDPGSAAERAGVERGDIVSQIGERSTRELPMWELHELLAGREGRVVELEVVRQGSPTGLEIQLSPSNLPAPELEEVAGYAVLKVPEFRNDTYQLVTALLDKLDQRPLLVDLRGVAGGDADAAYEVAGLFAVGKLGELRKREQTLEEFTVSGKPVFEPAPGLLVNRGSQGAAEVFAAVLAQSAGALVLGEPTFGHAGRAERVALSSGGFINLTSAFYTGADLAPIDKSLTPEVLIQDRRFGGEEIQGDPVLEKAIEALRERASEQAPEARRVA